MLQVQSGNRGPTWPRKSSCWRVRHKQAMWQTIAPGVINVKNMMTLRCLSFGLIKVPKKSETLCDPWIKLSTQHVSQGHTTSNDFFNGYPNSASCLHSFKCKNASWLVPLSVVSPAPSCGSLWPLPWQLSWLLAWPQPEKQIKKEMKKEKWEQPKL